MVYCSCISWPVQHVRFYNIWRFRLLYILYCQSWSSLSPLLKRWFGKVIVHWASEKCLLNELVIYSIFFNFHYTNRTRNYTILEAFLMWEFNIFLNVVLTFATKLFLSYLQNIISRQRDLINFLLIHVYVVLPIFAMILDVMYLESCVPVGLSVPLATIKSVVQKLSHLSITKIKVRIHIWHLNLVSELFWETNIWKLMFGKWYIRVDISKYVF